VVPVLQRLTDLGILEKRSPMGDEVFAFRHILAQETVYGSLMRSDRPAIHRAVAESIEQLHGGDLQEQAEVLALHYDRARLRDKAMHYALLAGDRARARFANSEAAKYYGRALQLSQHLSDCQKERWHAAVGLGHIQQHVGEYKEAVACYLAALEERRDALPEERAQVMLRLGQVWGDKRGDLDEGERWLREGLSLLLASGQAAPGLTAQILCELGWLSTRRGDFVAAQEQLERALEMVEETENYDVISFILNRLGFVHYSRSEWDLAKACVERALAFRERIGDSVGHSRSLINLGIMKQVSGDWDGALADFERAAETQDRIGEVEGVILAHTNLGVLYTERGEWSRAEESLQRSFSLAQRIEHPHQLALAHTNLGRLFLLQQLWSKGAEHLNAAIPLFREAGAHAHLGLFEVYNLFGRLCLDQEDVGGAEAWAERSHALLREVTGGDDVTSLEWGRHLQLIARIARARGDMGAARRHLDRSTTIFEQLGTTIETARTAYWSAVFFCDSGLVPQARKELNVAREIFERLGASADLDRVVQLLTLL
jgi:tetratricopeptide (TPR) repeat protein